MKPYNEAIIPLNKWTRPGGSRTVTRNTVWHYTSNKGASARNHYIYFGKTLPAQNARIEAEAAALTGDAKKEKLKEVIWASANFFIDKIETLCIIPPNEPSYHASQANPYSVGVELCIEADGSFHPETIRRAIELGAYLAKEYGQNPDTDFLRHYDVTGKLCPLRWVQQPKEWDAFRASVTAKIKGKGGAMDLEHEWQWKMLGDALDGLYRKGVISDYTWAEKAYKMELTADECSWLNMIILARKEGVDV